MNSPVENPAVMPTVDEFVAGARSWLEANAARKGEVEEPFSVSVFHALTDDEERALLRRLQDWQQRKASMGFHAIMWPTERGGLGLSKEHAKAFADIEGEYVVPSAHETFSVTTRLIAPTVEQFGTPEQRDELVAAFLRTDLLCCQLFSEPGAGSDLASLSCRAVRDGDEWVVNGQKIWSSGARFAEWGELIVRTDPDVVKHKGLTAFVMPMDLPGIEIRPIKQMSGGASFNEVFFTDARIPDRYRVGGVGDGWNVALTTLGFERDHSDKGKHSKRPGGAFPALLETARALGRTDDPTVRDALAKTYIRWRIEHFVNQRAADIRASGAAIGPEGSLGKLYWTEGMRHLSDAVSIVLGPRLLADTGEAATFGWGEHVLGAPGYRIAGGSDEVQRNILGERVLGLPGEPRVDKGAWKDVPR